MTVTGKAKIVQYLGQAHAADQAWSGLLAAHIAMTPSGAYRKVLERQRSASDRHAQKVARRLDELGQSGDDRGVVGTGTAAVTSLWGKAVAVTKVPFSLLRGSGGEDKMVHNAIEEAAQLQRTAVTYRVLAHLADALDDQTTADLANSIADDKTSGLGDLDGVMDSLVAAAVRADVQGKGSYDVSKTGAGQKARRLVDEGRDAVRDASDEARSQAKQARKVPGVAQVEGEVKGAVADADDLAIANYDDLTADEITGRLGSLSQVDLAKVDAYERKNSNRSTVLDRISSLRGDEPWPGYDDQTVVEIRKALTSADEQLSREVRTYERRHKDRSGVIEATEAAIAGS